jgi:nitrogen fixation protein FixH
MKGIHWSEFEEQGDPREPEPVKTRVRRRLDEDEDQIVRKQKKSGKRFHRKKTLKDELWKD